MSEEKKSEKKADDTIFYTTYLTADQTAKDNKETSDNKFLPNGELRQRRKRTSKNSRIYVDPHELMDELLEFKRTDIISENLGSMFIKMAIRFTSSSKFNGYSWRDEFISCALIRIVKYIDKFDPERENCNPFAYISKIIEHEVIKIINKEKKIIDTNNRLRTAVWTEIETENGLEHVDLNEEG